MVSPCSDWEIEEIEELGSQWFAASVYPEGRSALDPS